MRTFRAAPGKFVFCLLAAVCGLAAADQTYTGTITDSMCGKSHASMKMGTDANCTIACVKAGAKYVLFDGVKTYTLGDQTMPERYAGKHVTVTGSLDKSGVLQVAKIEPAK